MTVAELMVKISADIGGLQRAIFESKLELRDLQGSIDSMGNTGGGGRGFLGGITSFLTGIPRLAGQADRWFQQLFTSSGQWLQGLGGGLPIIGAFGSAIAAMAPGLAAMTTGLVGAVVGIVALVAVAVAVLTVINLLIIAISDLAALVVTMLGPLGVLIAAFGGLALAGTQAWKVLNDKHIPMFHHLQDVLGALDSQFGVLIRRLANDFLPIITTIAQALRPFVSYLEKVVSMPLSGALHSLATQGMSEFNHLLGVVTHALANPVRMIIDFAFGQGGTAVNSEIARLAHRFSNFVFQGPRWVEHGKGPAGARGGGTRIQIGQSLWQEVQTWFSHQHIEALGHTFAAGFMSAAGKVLGAGKVWDFLASSLLQAFERAYAQINRRFNELLAGALNAVENWAPRAYEVFVYWLGQLTWTTVKRYATEFWNWATGKVGAWASRAYGWITGQLGAAVDWVKARFQGFWNWLTGLLSRVLTIHVSIPGLSTIQSVLGAAGGAVGGAAHMVGIGAAGGLVTRPTLAVLGEAGPEMVVPLSRMPGAYPLGASGGGVVHVHLHNPLILGDRQTARQTARWLAPLLKQQVFGG